MSPKEYIEQLSEKFTAKQVEEQITHAIEHHTIMCRLHNNDIKCVNTKKFFEKCLEIILQ